MATAPNPTSLREDFSVWGQFSGLGLCFGGMQQGLGCGARNVVGEMQLQFLHFLRSRSRSHVLHGLGV